MPATQPADAEHARPSPEALLAAAAENRGRLKVFLGAAPGVGKTYEMLTAGRARRKEGIDVVIGIVETHKRAETEALLDGFEIVPRKQVPYRDRTLDEMDIDAILARKPRLVLVDELAHTNAPGSRHEKRYQDVEELLSAGIDVYSTLNIQHIESLNDVVAQITTVRVRETLPDHVIDKADEVELIDLTPKDLIQRLNEGKVYVPEVAQRALSHYFSEGNLTALRELALRRTAQRVDDQMLTYMQAHAIPGPWAAGERILVCINEHPSAAGLIRYARRAADRLQARWVALYIETPRYHQIVGGREGPRGADPAPGGAAGRDRGDAARPRHRRRPAGLCARQQHHPDHHRQVAALALVRAAAWLGGGRAGAPLRQYRRAGAGGGGGGVRAGVAPRHGAAAAFQRRAVCRRHCPDALATAIGYFFDRQIDLPNMSMIFIPVVLFGAIRHGLLPSLWATVLVDAGLQLLLHSTRSTPSRSRIPQNIVALLFLLLVAIIASQLAAQSRAQAEAARRQAASTAALYGFSRKIAGIGNMDDLLWAIAHQIALMLKAHVVMLLPDSGDLIVRTGYPPEDELDEADLAAAKWSWSRGQVAGRSSDTLPGAKRLFLPLRTERGLVGVMGLDRPNESTLLSPDERRLLDALADQAAVAIERISLAAGIDEARVTGETERMRSALLTSISHDLKTPLASIIGSITSLRKFWPTFEAETRDELLGTVQDEAERLTRFVGNVLDMTRLEAKSVAPQLFPADVAEMLGIVAGDVKRALPMLRLSVEAQAGLQPALMDAHLFRQVMFNLLDNAAKYAPADSTVRILARQTAQGIAIEVTGRGAGDSARRSRAHLRQVLPRPGRRPAARRHRPRPLDLQGLRRGDGRQHRGGEPDRWSGSLAPCSGLP